MPGLPEINPSLSFDKLRVPEGQGPIKEE